MGLVLIQRACERFQQQLSVEENRKIQAVANVDDVRHAIRRIEQHLAARLSLRNLDRLTPFLDAIDRLSKPIDVLCNGTPFLPYVWAPLKLILQTAQHHTHALDKLLSAYGSIGVALPRLARYGETFPDNFEFQQLLAYLYGDIIEFHRRAYRLIQKPGWKMFFSSGWGRFEHQFDALLQSIAQNSELIDKEAASFDIIKAQEWRQKSLEDAANREKRWEFEQREMVLRWLEVGDSKSNQEGKLEWLRDHCCEGTSQWLTKSQQVRSWLQLGRGHSVLWLHGKPGSGKSVLCSQLIYFLRADPTRNCLFFFCDFHTTNYGVTAKILRSLCAQMIDLAPELASFIYDEGVVVGLTPSVSYLKTIVPKLLTAFKDIRIVIDGTDEVGYSQHRELIKTLASLTEAQDNCKVLFSSQDIPSIRSNLKSKPELFLGAESASVAEDLDIIVAASLKELNYRHDRHGGIPDTVLIEVRKSILERAEGMFLWVYLVLKILEAASSIEDLRTSVKNLPKGLADAYNKILTNITRSSAANDLSKQRRVFGWMLFAKGNQPLRKHELRLAMTLHSESCIVNKDTKPFPNALDICKPFIEDGPRGCVVFIHSTVPQFLLDHSYGPFINEIDAHRDISIACLGQLLQSLCFVAECSNPTHRQYLIGQGFHGLLPYAIENWTEHLLDYVEKAPEGASFQVSPVMQKLRELSHEHGQLSVAQRRQESQGTPALKPKDHDSRLNRLKELPVAFTLLNCAMHFREAIKATNEPPPSSSDPTLFSLIRKAYHEDVVHLMAQSSCPGLSQEELMVFKEEFGPSAFVCHVRGCERSVVGYSTANGLRDHEARHQGLLKCSEPSCSYTDIGFSSSKLLNAHRRRLHPAPAQMGIPQQMRRKRPRESRESHTSVQETPPPSQPSQQQNAAGEATPHGQPQQQATGAAAGAQASNADATGPNPQAQQPKIPDHIMNHVNKMTFRATAQLTEKSKAEATEWVEEIRERYGRALMTMENSKQKIAQIDKLINDRAQAENPFGEEELRQLHFRKEKQLKVHLDAMKWVESVREQQSKLQGTGRAEVVVTSVQQGAQQAAATQERKKAYWSVSESIDFPHLLASFGSDWTAIAAHMGSKTATMVKNHFMRQKNWGKAEWDTIVQEADGKRARGEPRPDPPQPSTSGRGGKYDSSSSS